MQPATSFWDQLGAWLPKSALRIAMSWACFAHCPCSSCYFWSLPLPVHAKTATAQSSAHTTTVGHASRTHTAAFLCQVRQNPSSTPRISHSWCAQRFQRQRATLLWCVSTTELNSQPGWGQALTTSPPHVSNASFKAYHDQPLSSFYRTASLLKQIQPLAWCPAPCS